MTEHGKESGSESTPPSSVLFCVPAIDSQKSRKWYQHFAWDHGIYLAMASLPHSYKEMSLPLLTATF